MKSVLGVKPDLSHLGIFGSEAYVIVPKQHLKKLDARAKKMILVGYESNSTNYRVFDPVNKKVKVSRDVRFHEVVGPSVLSAKDESCELTLPKNEENERIVQAPEEEEEDDDEVFQLAEEEEFNRKRNSAKLLMVKGDN